MLNNFLIALFLTTLIEIVVSLFFKIKNKDLFLIIILINLITNPILNYLLRINNFLSLFPINIGVFLFFEILIILIEWRLLVFTLKLPSRKLFFLSLTMNLCSYIIGFILLG